jgi:TRAP-type C4-dicarboxylate transport system permease small subunit
MRKRLEWALDRLHAAVDVLAIVLFLLMLVLVIASVVLRAAGDPLIWGDELTRYLFVWVALLAWSIAARRKSHIAIYLFVEMLPRRVRFGLEMATHAAVVLFALIMVVQGVRMTIRNLDIETITLFFTFAVVYAAAPVAGVLVALETARQALDTVCAHMDGEAPR